MELKDQQNSLGEVLLDFKKFEIHIYDFAYKFRIFAEIFGFVSTF